MTTAYSKKLLGLLGGDKKKEGTPDAKGGKKNLFRRWNITNNSDDCGPDDSTEIRIIPKERETKDLLHGALRDHYLFAQLSEADLDHMINVMQRVTKAPGEVIIRQGDKGQDFFILETGSCEIYVNDNRVGDYNTGGCFGELALIYNAKRAATITAATNATLWSLDLRTFRRMLAQSSSSNTVAKIEFLRKVPLLKNLTNDQVSKLSGALQTESFKDGQYVIRQGDAGNKFYLIKEGSIKCTQKKMDREVELITLSAGDYFGEMALLLDEPRHANCIAVGDCEIMSLEKDAFIKLLGPVREVLARQMRIRVLKSVPLLARLSDMELDQVGNAMRVQLFNAGDYIIREGEIGTRFYIINEGTVRCCKKNAEGKEEELVQFKEQDYFGERALLRSEQRAASVIANGRVECLVLEREHFTNLLGDLSNVMEKEAKSREQSTTSSTSTSKVVGPSVDFAFNDLNILRMLGTGTFGRVKLVQHRPTGTIGALKCMMKAQIVNCHQEKNLMNEKNLLYACAHTFVLGLLSTYSDHDQVYMLMELVQGGELWSYVYDRFDLIPRTKFGGFTKEHTQFYIGCVISAFSFIHGQGIAYRDLKPENLLMDRHGFVKVIDFGFAKHIPFEKNGALQTKSFTLCGTPEYLSPELVLSRGHDKSVDYWALGCLVYELLIGRTPFQDDNQNEIFKKIIHSHKSLAFPKGIDSDAVDMIKKLLSPNPAFRLGNLMGGVSEIQQHPFFNGFSWENLEARAIPAPYTPHIKDDMDVECFDDMGDEEDAVIPYTGQQKYFEEF